MNMLFQVGMLFHQLSQLALEGVAHKQYRGTLEMLILPSRDTGLHTV